MFLITFITVIMAMILGYQIIDIVDDAYESSHINWAVLLVIAMIASFLIQLNY